MRRSVWVAFAVFCLLSSGAWLLVPVAEAVEGAVIALVGLAAYVAGGRRGSHDGVASVWLGVTSLLVLGVPEALTVWANGHVAGVLVPVVFALVPIVTVLVVAQSHLESADGGAMRLLAPGVIGLGGLLLVIPFDLPGSTIGLMAMGVLMVAAVLVSVSSVAIHRQLQGFSMLRAIAVVCGINGLFLMGVGVIGGGWRWAVDGLVWQVGVAVVCAAVQMVLLVVLLRAIEPVRFATRYLWIPLLTIVGGYVVMRPGLTVRMGAGIVVLVVGAGWILFSRRLEGASALSLRGRL